MVEQDLTEYLSSLFSDADKQYFFPFSFSMAWTVPTAQHSLAEGKPKAIEELLLCFGTKQPS